MKKILITLLGLTFCTISAQKKHTVMAKETPYGIAKKYGISLDELFKQNPKIKDGTLNIGDILIIPNQKSQVEKTPNKTQKKLGKIILQPKQTIYGITKQYKISEAELRQLNPDIDQHMRIGDAVILPEENIKKYGDAAATQTPTITKEEAKISQQDKDIYIIQPKDTYQSITKKFGISKRELFALNPELEKKGLKVGDIIKIDGPIPTQNTSQASTEQDNSIGEYLTHIVQKGDTAFGIINKYNISYEQLEKLNNGLSGGIKEGSILRIKKFEKQYINTNENTFNIALMLPFGFDSNDSKYRSLATDFLIGAKIAAERNTAKGKKISLNVIDAESENTFKNNLSQINKSNTNLIIGPFFKSNVIETLHYVKEDKIPVVAPFANSSDLYDYQNLILVETSNRTYAERIAEEVKKVYDKQKIYIVGDSNDSEVNFLKTKFEKDLAKANIAVVSSPASIELEQNMLTGSKAPAIIILADDNERTGKAFAQKLVELGKLTNGIKAFSMYYHSDFEKNINGLSQTNLVYLMDRKINTEGKFEKEIIEEFRKKYCKTPSKYMIIGFDVVNDMLSREQQGKVIQQMEKTQTHLATKFEYVRAKKDGAFINTGYRVVRLIP